MPTLFGPSDHVSVTSESLVVVTVKRLNHNLHYDPFKKKKTDVGEMKTRRPSGVLPGNAPPNRFGGRTNGSGRNRTIRTPGGERCRLSPPVLGVNRPVLVDPKSDRQVSERETLSQIDLGVGKPVPGGTGLSEHRG